MSEWFHSVPGAAALWRSQLVWLCCSCSLFCTQVVSFDFLTIPKCCQKQMCLYTLSTSGDQSMWQPRQQALTSQGDTYTSVIQQQKVNLTLFPSPGLSLPLSQSQPNICKGIKSVTETTFKFPFTCIGITLFLLLPVLLPPLLSPFPLFPLVLRHAVGSE